ncbi:hypothetical protein NQ314_011118 [Rhamnusium bicolor]|uniref:BPL/LPL catalytic domain-containing protein n=1 Tax=Rhamnusium bicolor TaxID=1586634 RepID=A0AAV8XLJ5_9CUCU|nr:hypothetical protein NQ314_011118 [Rhamnusium bicolor]
MFFTIFYMYATVMQWWRLGSLKNKLNGTLNSQNALLVCNESVIFETKKSRSFENLLFRSEDRVGCTIVPKVENFGELIAWKVTDHFEAILKTDIDKLTKLVHCYSQSAVDINHELKLLRIETVDIEGSATRIKYDRRYSLESTLKYSHAPVYWKKFVESLKETYSKIRDTTTPKITIENGATKPDDIKKVPVSEVKPIKKDSKKSEDKNTLEVGASDYRRHKSSDHKRDKSSDKYAKTDLQKSEKETSKNKDEHKISRTDKEVKAKDVNGGKDAKDDKEKHRHHHRKDKDEEARKDSKEEKDGMKLVKDHSDMKKGKDVKVREHHHQKESKDEIHKVKEHHQHKKDKETSQLKAKSKNDLEQPSKSSDKRTEEKSKETKILNKRSTSSEKKLVKSVAVCEEADNDLKEKEPNKSEKSRSQLQDNERNGGVLDSNGHFESNGSIFTKYKGVKPPNILVYADSPVAKDNVKAALSTILNKEKYIVYDLPTNPNQMAWNGSTVLVVVCGTVSPDMTSHLLQYLLSGGQLLCLCSDLLYSVLHTFTTAEVREHELVRFTYGKWKQVKMMHHIFCYQASPAKKQFSKDSDHSNQSSGNGSSPIAPRTPSTVEIQHNGKEYTIQVQVLGTEETWQTPSLLLANVKGGEGRAIFSQVHLEINPNQYEDDENKFAALKDSDQARMEILRDILSNHLEVDCTNVSDVTYTPAYFLGRHDALETEHIGRLVIYCDVLASSQLILNKTLTHGIVVIPRQQTKGIGRSNNVWLSPIGSANFSMQLHIPVSSPLGKVLPLVQHLVMVGIVHSIRKSKGCQDLNIGIKWPNDLYANGNIKIGGILANSSVIGTMAVINIGAGVNLDNANPTLCLNDLIRTSNIDKGTSIKIISYEAYFAAVFNEVEKLINEFQGGNMDYINCNITVTTKDGEKQKVRITGIDDVGFLKVRSEDGAIITVQPDGNTFDMLKGLISPRAL